MLQLLVPMLVKAAVTTITTKEAIATAAATAYVYDKLKEGKDDTGHKPKEEDEKK